MRVLVVEDEFVIASMVEMTLLDCGCSVEIAHTVDEALALLEKKKFDTATVDVNLHGQQSWTVMEALHGQSIPFAVASSLSCMEMKSQLDQVGNPPCISKPYGPEDIEVFIKSFQGD